jgi:multiple sugar transport system ATP-binding protein
MARVVFDSVTRIYDGNAVPAVSDLRLDIADGEFMVLVGPSGSGKSTALRMLAGLEPLDGGRILIGDDDVSDRPPKDRDIAMVFQNYALFPHLDVEGNIGFGLRLRHVAKKERAERVREAAAMLDLTELLPRKVSQLSGGQRQRVAMGRAIVREPQVFLMDEPLSNLDAKLRTQTRTQIASLQRRLKVTTVYVTHDQVEAMTMGDRVAVMRDGALQQVGSPRELYERPRNTFVAGFIGSPAMNLRRCRVDKGTPVLAGLPVPLADAAAAVAARPDLDEIILGIRPESCQVGPTGCALRVDVVEVLGADAFVYGHLDGDDAGEAPFVVRVDAAATPDKGAQLHVTPTGRLHLFDPAGGDRLDP